MKSKTAVFHETKKANIKWSNLKWSQSTIQRPMTVKFEWQSILLGPPKNVCKKAGIWVDCNHKNITLKSSKLKINEFRKAKIENEREL